MGWALGLWLAVGVAACGGDDGGGRGGADAGPRDSGSTGDAGPGPGSDAGCADDAACDDGLYCNGAERCASGTCVAGDPPDCDDGVACTADSCSEEERTCLHDAADLDGDEHTDRACGGDDCDDTNPRRYIGAAEICDPDDVDEDCDPSTYGFRDADMDSYGDAACCNDTTCGDDCNDMASGVHPGLAETCDDRDNDCDGMTDEGVLVTFYRDADGDGYAADGAGVESVTTCFAPTGFVTTRGDCNDAAPGVSPAAYDSCDAARLDENCDGVPNNPPMGCACTVGEIRMCMLPGRCASGREMCVAGAWGACSVMPIMEICNGEDDDCNGTTDDGMLVTCYRDVDGDGYAAAGATTSTACTCGMGTTPRAPTGSNIDCDDTTPSRSPAAAEICDGLDQDCDGTADEGLPTTTVYRDVDGDGHYGSRLTACMGTPGTSTTSTDCNDADADAFPGQTMYFTDPYCRATSGSWYACRSSLGWACYDTPSTVGCGLARGTPRPAPSWDYDCNGMNDRIADRNTGCSSLLACSTFPACVGNSGFDYDPAAPPACGQQLMGSAVPRHWYCGCDASSRCMANYDTADFPCR